MSRVGRKTFWHIRLDITFLQVTNNVKLKCPYNNLWSVPVFTNKDQAEVGHKSAQDQMSGPVFTNMDQAERKISSRSDQDQGKWLS